MIVVEVKQCDRDAAWKVRASCYDARDRANWNLGVYDKVVEIQTLATHRIATEITLQATLDRAVEVIQYIVTQLADGDEPGIDDDGDEIDPLEQARAFLSTMKDNDHAG